MKCSLLILLLVYGISINSQDSASHKIWDNMAIKGSFYPIAGPVIGFIGNVFFEKLISDNHSVSLGFKYMNYMEIGEFEKVNTTSIIAEYRYYAIPNKEIILAGAYVSPYLKYRFWNSTERTQHKSSSIDIKNQALGVGLTLGYQDQGPFLFFNNILYNFYGGFGAMNTLSESISKIDFKSSSILNRHYDVRIGFVLGFVK